MYIYPTSTHSVSDSFQDHVNRGSVNPGTDYTAPYGSAVLSVAAGVVTDADSRPTGSGGRVIHVDHEDGTGADYLHLSRVDVRAGQHVAQGQQLGLSGASGEGQDHYYGPHLHISFRRNHSHGYMNVGNIDFATVVGGDAPAAGGDAEVREAQTLLNQHGYKLVVDGIHGPATDAAVRDWQTRHGLTVDGIVGPQTLGSLRAAAVPAAPSVRSLSRGSTGEDVKALQAFLNRVYPAYSSLVVDGVFGPATEAVVKEFQRRSGITADGIVGPVTRAKLGI